MLNYLVNLLPGQVEADRLPGDVDGRRRGHVEHPLRRDCTLAAARQHGSRRAGVRARPRARREVAGLRDGAVSLALLDERLVGRTGTATGDDTIIIISAQDWLESDRYRVIRVSDSKVMMT